MVKVRLVPDTLSVLVSSQATSSGDVELEQPADAWAATVLAPAVLASELDSCPELESLPQAVRVKAAAATRTNVAAHFGNVRLLIEVAYPVTRT